MKCKHCGYTISIDPNDERQVTFYHIYTGDPQCTDIAGELLPTWAETNEQNGYVNG